MNWSTAVPAGSFATHVPVARPTAARRAAKARAASRLTYHPMAELVADPSGDFTLGMPLNLPEIAHGLRLGVWSAGTSFRQAGRLLTVDAEGQLRDEAGEHVILVSSIGR